MITRQTRLFDIGIRTGSIEILQTLLDFGVDPEWVGPSGDSSLAAAVAAGKVGVVAFLLDHGVEPNWGGGKRDLGPVAFVLFTTIATNFGLDPRPDLPKDTRRVEILQLLHEHGADLGISFRGKSLLEFAAAELGNGHDVNDEIAFLRLVLKVQTSQ